MNPDPLPDNLDYEASWYEKGWRARDAMNPDPLRAPGTDDFLGLGVERPRSGMVIVAVAVVLGVLGLLVLFLAVAS